MSPRPKILPSALFSLTLILPGSLFLTDLGAQSNCYTNPSDTIPCAEGEYEEEWKELEVPIPALAKDSEFKLLAVTEADSRYQYYLAENSISLGTDGVMRYTVAVVSGNGVRNVFYEGLRCYTNEIKTYAYATNRGNFRPALNNRWRPVANKGVRAYQDFLTNGIICDADGYAWEAQKARRALLRQVNSGAFRRIVD